MSSKRSNPTKWLIKGGLLLFCFLALLTPLFAEIPPPNKKVILQGRVLDRATRHAIAKAKVSSHSASASTDRQGRYKISLPINSAQKIILKTEASGYQAKAQTLKILPNRNYKVNFRLVPGTPTTIPIPPVPVLSISVSPNSWNIGKTTTNKIITMKGQDKITITNNSSLPETLEIKLIDPKGWKASGNNGREAYVLSGLLCGLAEVPEEAHFNQGGNEDVITPLAKRATTEVFAYKQAAYNGTAIPAGGKRVLYLQFKAPTITQSKDEQNISVIISAQEYY